MPVQPSLPAFLGKGQKMKMPKAAETIAEASVPVGSHELFSRRAALLLCAAARPLLTLLVALPSVGDFRVADSYRLVGKVDLATAVRYFSETTGFGRSEYRPVVMLTYALDDFLWKSDPTGYHLSNVVLHGINGILLLFVLQRLTGSLLVAFCSSVLFVIHPSNHSRVAWIAARDSSVCLLFLLLSWWTYLARRRSRPSTESESPAPTTKTAAWDLVSLTTFALALLSYEGATSFPFLLLAMELLFNKKSDRWTDQLSSAASAALPYFLLLAVYITWWLVLFHAEVGAHDLDLSLRGTFQDFYRLHYRLFHGIQHWQGILYVAIGYLLWRRRIEYFRLACFSVLVLWIGHLPFVPVRGFADRFGFLSCVGVALFLSLPLQAIARQGLATISLSTIAPALLLLFLVGYYTDSMERRLQQWAEAGVLASSIVAQTKAIHSTFPPNTHLVFEQIPARHGEAYVFPVGFSAALREQYGSRALLNIAYSSGPAEQAIPEQVGAKTFRFVYSAEENRLMETSARPRLTSR
jgi:hypothetical protein